MLPQSADPAKRLTFVFKTKLVSSIYSECTQIINFSKVITPPKSSFSSTQDLLDITPRKRRTPKLEIPDVSPTKESAEAIIALKEMQISDYLHFFPTIFNILARMIASEQQARTAFASLFHLLKQFNNFDKFENFNSDIINYIRYLFNPTYSNARISFHESIVHIWLEYISDCQVISFFNSTFFCRPFFLHFFRNFQLFLFPSLF